VVTLTRPERVAGRSTRPQTEKGGGKKGRRGEERRKEEKGKSDRSNKRSEEVRVGRRKLGETKIGTENVFGVRCATKFRSASIIL
jgi:hypothetical protein